MAIRKVVTRPVISINKAWCKGCGICVSLCPKKALALDSSKKAVLANPGACVGCETCVLLCPDYAINMGVQ